MEMSPIWLKHMYSVLSALTWRPMPPAACSRLCSRVSACASVFARSTMSSAKSASLIICAGYLLIISFASLKPLQFQLWVSSTNYTIEHYSLICSLLNVLQCITNNSIKPQSFVYKQFKDQTILFLTIQFNINHLFVHSLNVKQFYLTEK